MTYGSQQDPVLYIIQIIILRLTRNKDIPSISDRVIDKKRATSSANGHLTNRSSRKRRMVYTANMKYILYSQQEIPFIILRRQVTYDSRANLAPTILKRIEINNRFLVRMWSQQCPGNRLSPVLGQDNFQTDLFLMMCLA